MTKVRTIKVQNLKAIASQELNLNGATAIITGANNKGKSTLLRSLKDRLLKLKADQIIRHGETDGVYEMSFTSGDVITWELTTKTRAGEKLTLISKDGTKTSVITEIINWFQPGSFDIDKFLNESPASQRKTLEKLLGLDFTQLDQRYARAVEERRDANRDVERIEINYKGKDVDPELQVELIPVEDMQKGLLGIESHNKAYNLMVDEEARLLERRNALEIELRSINTRLATLDIDLTKKENQPISPEQVQELQLKLHTAEQANIQIKENNTLRTALSELTTLKEQAHQRDIVVKDILAEKDALIKSANMPDGFTFGSEGILYNGLELDRQSQSSSALYIAALKLASINVGNVRFLHFDASFLDKNSLKEVLAWAESEDLQILLERVDLEAGDIRYEVIEEDWLNN